MNNVNIKIYNIGKEKYESFWLDDKPLDSLSYFDLCKKYKKIMKGGDISNRITDRSLLLQQFKAILKNEIIKRYSKKDNNYHNCIIVNCTCPLCQEEDPKLTTILSKSSPSWLDRLKLVFNFFNKYFSINNNNNNNNNNDNNNNQDQTFTIYLHNSILFSFLYTHRKVLNINDNSTDSEIKRFITDTLAWHPKYFFSGKDDHRLNGCKGYWKMAIQSKDEFNAIYSFSPNISYNGNTSFIKFLIDSPILLINKTTKKLNYQKSTKINKLLLSNSDEDYESDSSEEHQDVHNVHSSKIWGSDISSILYKMSLLQSWSGLLDGLSKESKELIWSTCSYFVNFGNYDQSSFSKTLFIWGSNLFSNLHLINILFSAIGYLKEMNEIEGDFYYLDSNVKVFKEFIFDDHSSGSEEYYNSSENDLTYTDESTHSSRNNSPVNFEIDKEFNETSNSISFDKLSIRSNSPSSLQSIQQSIYKENTNEIINMYNNNNNNHNYFKTN
ncbi:hypothetical protein DICPUDRAFT_158786, partial [Dictyostelium purpureum]